MTTTLVSIVIPAYNDERFLAEAIESALGQKNAEAEVIVVDDGSTDGTAQVAESFGDAVTLRRKENGGPSSARNAGLDVVHGECVVFLDGDDVLFPDFVSRTLAVLDSHPEAAFVYGQMQYFGRETGISTWPPYSSAELLRGNFITLTSLIRANVCREVGFNEGLRSGWEDWDFFLSLAERGYSGIRIDEPLFLYRKHETADRLSDLMVEPANKRRARLAIMRKHLRLFGPRRYLHYLAHHVKETLHL